MTAEKYLEENLSVTHYRNGDEIPQVTDPVEWAGLTTGAWCHYDNNPDNEEKYGKLYNWYTVNDPRGLAPQGYHVLTDAEWDNIKLDTVYGGYRNSNGSFNHIGLYGYWWSSTENYTSDAWYRFLNTTNSYVIRNLTTKSLGFSVRCVRDVELTESLENKTEISDEQWKKIVKEMGQQPMIFVPNEISDEEIEVQALTFAKEESYGELNSDLWKGYVFGAKWYREQLKQK